MPLTGAENWRPDKPTPGDFSLEKLTRSGLITRITWKKGREGGREFPRLGEGGVSQKGIYICCKHAYKQNATITRHHR